GGCFGVTDPPATAGGTDLISCARRALRRYDAVVERIDSLFHFGREADAVELITPQAAHGLRDFADLADHGTRVAVLNVDARLRFSALNRVVVVIGNIARVVFDEIIVRL